MKALEHLLQTARASMLKEPFPHAIVHPALPWDVYYDLECHFPDPMLVVGKRPVLANKLYQYHAKDVLHDERIEKCWRQFFYEATDPSFYDEVGKIIDVPAGPCGVRFRTTAPVELDCLFAVNSPVERESSVKGPHLDNPREVFACLIYFPEQGDDAGGNLATYKYVTDKPKFFGQRFTKDVIVDRVCAYEPNTAFFFKNTFDSVHGVLPRQRTLKWRRYLNLESEYYKPLFSIP